MGGVNFQKRCDIIFERPLIALSQKPTPPTVLNVENSKLACLIVIRFRSW